MAKTGIDEPMIERLVRLFYQRIQASLVLLGPSSLREYRTGSIISRNSAPFGLLLVFDERPYHGQPMRMHMDLPVDGSHFDRWLALFASTAAEVCPPVAAEHFVERARRIADSLELGSPRHKVGSQRRAIRDYRRKHAAA